MEMMRIKVHLAKADGSVETRRLPIPKDLKELASSPGLFKTMYGQIANAFPDLNNKSFSLTWKDSDGDAILMSSDGEVQDAIHTLGNSTLQMFIKVDKDEKVEMSRLTEAFTSSEETDSQKDTGISHEEMQQGFQLFGFFPGMIGPHPQFPFHDSSILSPAAGSFQGRCDHPNRRMNRGRFFPGGFMGRGHFGIHPHTDGKGHHPLGHHCHGDHHPGSNNGNFHGKDFKQGAKWKTGLRNAVPQLHRRWAKKFIQKWRQEYLTNATTTTSDNGTDEELTFETAGVPEAYRAWLILMLPSWHRKWGTDEMNDMSNWNEPNKKERKQLKMSIPKEFLKWVEWYLQRHFGRRQVPRLKGVTGKNETSDQYHIEQTGLSRGNRHGHFKKHILASLVPAHQRIWAKKFIHDWRVQRKLEDLTVTATTSESDDGGVDVDQDDVSIPQDYDKWLEVFLPRWHHWRGLIEKVDDQENKGGMGKFKDTVPMDFRAWVKCFMCRRYGRQRPVQCSSQEEEESVMQNYRIWLKAFQKKWLEEQQYMGEDSEDATVLNSGDEGDANKPVSSGDNCAAPDSSFKRLHLSDEEKETQQKNVQFDPSLNEMSFKRSKTQEKMMKSMMDSDDGAEEMESQKGCRKLPINHRLRKWVWQELSNWDGQDLTESYANGQTSSQAEEVTDIPPRIYHWMFKVMMQLHKKKMKQEMKAVKRELNAAQKLAMA